MVQIQRLNELRSVDVNSVDKEMLTDVSGLILDVGIPQSQRLKQILTKTKNPYCFRVGDMCKAGICRQCPNAPKLLMQFFIYKEKRPLTIGSTVGQDSIGIDNLAGHSWGMV
jgi:hypothetical protein